MFSYQKLKCIAVKLARRILGAACLTATVSGLSIAAVRAAEEPERVRPPAPVLMVHGSGLTPASWESLRAELRERGYPDVYLRAVELTPADGSNRTAASRSLEPAMDELIAASQRFAAAAGWEVPDKIDVVAHSMGAISSRLVVKRHPERVRRWIGIAPANHGTDALCGYPGMGDRELCPAFARSAAESPVQFELNGGRGFRVDETPFGLGPDPRGLARVHPDERRAIAYYTIRIDPDRWIVPASSAVLAGAGGLPIPLPAQIASRVAETTPGNYLIREALDHDFMPSDPTVMQLVKLILGAPEPAGTR